LSEKLFQTTMVGSYTRPPWLIDAIREQKAEKVSEDHVRVLKEQAKLLTIKEMEDAGLDMVTDGEQGRTSFYEYLTEQLTGFAVDSSRPFADGTRNVSLRRAVAKVGFRGEVTAVGEAEFLRAHTARKTKVAVISPNFLADYWKPDGYYKTRDAFMEDMVKVSKEEARALANKVDCVQWDAPGFTRYTEPAISDADATKLIRQEVETLNSVIQSATFPAGSQKAVHVCWGNYKSLHQRDGPLLRILPELLDLKVDILFVELASARHEDDVDAFREYPTKMKVAAGVIDIKTPDVEPAWLVKKRAERLLRYIDAGKLILSTDCGYAPSWDSDRIPRSSCYLKLRSMALAAEELRATGT
jgi:5-methyltetrahydropteroyltriglutamate--homocysteine methyltransferase